LESFLEAFLLLFNSLVESILEFIARNRHLTVLLGLVRLGCLVEFKVVLKETLWPLHEGESTCSLSLREELLLFHKRRELLFNT
jgi:hypothetical protein